MQSFSWNRAGHTFPPLQGSTVTARERETVPWPQVAVQAPNTQLRST
jgi:hypothetical protein